MHAAAGGKRGSGFTCRERGKAPPRGREERHLRQSGGAARQRVRPQPDLLPGAAFALWRWSLERRPRVRKHADLVQPARVQLRQQRATVRFEAAYRSRASAPGSLPARRATKRPLVLPSQSVSSASGAGAPVTTAA